MDQVIDIPAIEQFNDLIHQQANFCWLRMPIPKSLEYEDLISEGAMAYMEAAKGFDTGRSIKFITYFHAVLRNRFAQLLRQSYQHKQKWQAWPCGSADTEARAEMKERLTDIFCAILSQRALLFVRELISPSQEFEVFCQNAYKWQSEKPTIMRCRIARFFGMDQRELQSILAELRDKHDILQKSGRVA